VTTRTGILLAVFLCLLLLGAIPASGQEAAWGRLISAGDKAMASQQYSRAESSYRAALTFAEKKWKKDARVSGTLIKLAESCNAQGRKDDAEAFANQALAALSDALSAHKSKDAPEYYRVEVSAAIMDKAGDIFASHQKYSDAETMYLDVIATREHYAAEKPPANPNNDDFLRFIAQALVDPQTELADSYDKLGGLYRREGKYLEAVQQYQKSEAIREKQFGPDRPQMAQSLSDIGMCYALQGQYDQAEPLYKRVIAILEHNNDQEKPEMAVALENYSLVLRKIGRDAEAKTASERAHEIRTKLSATSN
jgi:tetratricopeptide (TPR) repeat protein